MSSCAFPVPAGAKPLSQAGPIKIGSAAHKTLFCRTLIETFNPYRPAVIDWPDLDEATRERLTRLPIWDIAVQTEGKAGVRVKTYGETISDPLLARAIALNAYEENRHKHVLTSLAAAYGITLAPEFMYAGPRDSEWAFMVTGYSECIDSFFAFGLFELARRSGFFPPELVDTFEPVMQEESRHILFFVNWAAWHRRNLPWWRRPWFALRRLGVWAFLVWERLSLARDVNGQDNNITLTGANQVGSQVGLRQLLDICLAENDRRLAAYDSRLLRPRVIPALAGFVHRAMGGATRLLAN